VKRRAAVGSWRLLAAAGLVATLAAAAGLAGVGGSAHAQAAPAAKAAPVPEIFRDADLPLGQRLMGEHACAACHIRRVGGDGNDIYNPRGRINTPGALRGMVDYCSTELNLGLFPEEVTAIAAVLQRDHYRFPVPSR
jgi:hypothetical protein